MGFGLEISSTGAHPMNRVALITMIQVNIYTVLNPVAE